MYSHPKTFPGQGLRGGEGVISRVGTRTINVTFIYYTPLTPPTTPTHTPISQKLTYNIVNHLSFPQSKNKKKKMLSGYCQYPSQSSEKLHVFTVVKGWKPESHWSCTLRNKFNARKTSRPSTKNDGLKIMWSYLGNPPTRQGSRPHCFSHLCDI